VTGDSIPTYMKRYFVRLGGFMMAYVVVLITGKMLANSGVPQWAGIALALLTAAPICGVFWTIFRLLAECDDEYQQMLLVRQTLLATAFTMSIVTVWQFLEVYDVTTSGPQWIGALWFAMWGIAAAVTRLRA
jgi:hypothetical protein